MKSKLSGKSKPEIKEIDGQKYVVKEFRDRTLHLGKSQIINEFLAREILVEVIKQIGVNYSWSQNIIIPQILAKEIDGKLISASVFQETLQTYEDQLKIMRKNSRVAQLDKHVPNFWMIYTSQFLLGNDDLNIGNLGENGKGETILVDFGRFFQNLYNSQEQFIQAAKMNYSALYSKDFKRSFDEQEVKNCLHNIKQSLNVEKLVSVFEDSVKNIASNMIDQLSSIQFEYTSFGTNTSQKITEKKTFNNMDELAKFTVNRLMQNFKAVGIDPERLINESMQDTTNSDDKSLRSSLSASSTPENTSSPDIFDDNDSTLIMNDPNVIPTNITGQKRKREEGDSCESKIMPDNDPFGTPPKSGIWQQRVKSKTNNGVSRASSGDVFLEDDTSTLIPSSSFITPPKSGTWQGIVENQPASPRSLVFFD